MPVIATPHEKPGDKEKLFDAVREGQPLRQGVGWYKMEVDREQKVVLEAAWQYPWGHNSGDCNLEHSVV